jgi:hypothetical protein
MSVVANLASVVIQANTSLTYGFTRIYATLAVGSNNSIVLFYPTG